MTVMSCGRITTVRDSETRGSAEDQSRTGDTRIFSPLLYRLSYLGAATNLPHAGPPVNVRYEGRHLYVAGHELPGFTRGTPLEHSGHSSAVYATAGARRQLNSSVPNSG